MRMFPAALAWACVVVATLTAPRLGWSMGTPPFDADLRSTFAEETRELLDSSSCLSLNDAVTVVSTYRNLRSRKPIQGKTLTMSLAFPAKDKKGSRLITVLFTGTTDSMGSSTFSIPLAEAVEEAERLRRRDRFYRGVRRVRGPITVSWTTEDTFERSVRYVPARGLRFRLCRPAISEDQD